MKMKWAQVTAMVAAVLVAAISQSALADDPPKAFKTAVQRREAWLENTKKQLFSDADRNAEKASEKSEKAARQLENDRQRLADFKARLKAKGKSWNPRERAEARKSILEFEKALRDREKNLPKAAEQEVEVYEIYSQGVPDRINKMRADLSQWPPIDCNNLKAGDVGKFPAFPIGRMYPEHTEGLRQLAKRLQQSEPLNAANGFLNALEFIHRRGISEATVRGEHNIKIVQILDDNQALATLLDLGDGDGGESFWLSGVDVAKFADGQTMKLDGVFFVSGTKQYETIKGAARTVHVIEPASIDQLKAWMAASK